MRILLIDDEWDLDSTRVEDLMSAGHDVTVINRADEAFARIADTSAKFDVVLLDVMMPPEGYASLQATNGGRLTGFRLLDDIRKHRGAIPVIVISAHSQSKVAGYLSQVNRYLEKPVRSSDILRAIEEVLK